MPAHPTDTPVPASPGHLVGRVGHLLARRVTRALADALDDAPNLDQWRVLDLLADRQGHPMTEIATHALVPAPTLTKIVDRLVESALAYRRPDDEDRRRVLAFLSDHGREVHAAMAPVVAAAEDEILDGLTDAERAMLVRLLERLIS